MLRAFFCIVLALYSLTLTAAEPAKPNLAKLQAVLGGKTPDSVNPTTIPGLYEVVIGSQILYLSEDGGFVIQGDIVDLNSHSNLTEVRRDRLRAQAIDALGENSMVVFAPTEPVKHTVTVFTDLDCGYCRKLHQEIGSYNQLGIKVRYLMFPRAGINSESYTKAVSVWCADDRRDALTRAKRGEAIPVKTCDNPVKQQYELGNSLGVRGTPSIVLENGEMVPGYIPPAKLARLLDGANPDADKQQSSQ